jgi:hypothetical protein
LELVNAYARMDGTPEQTRVAKELMAKFCAATAKPRKPAAAPTSSKTQTDAPLGVQRAKG